MVTRKKQNRAIQINSEADIVKVIEMAKLIYKKDWGFEFNIDIDEDETTYKFCDGVCEYEEIKNGYWFVEEVDGDYPGIRVFTDDVFKREFQMASND